MFYELCMSHLVAGERFFSSFHAQLRGFQIEVTRAAAVEWTGIKSSDCF